MERQEVVFFCVFFNSGCLGHVWAFSGGQPRSGTLQRLSEANVSASLEGFTGQLETNYVIAPFCEKYILFSRLQGAFYQRVRSHGLLSRSSPSGHTVTRTTQ